MIIRCLYCVLLLASLSYWNSEFEYFLERSRSPYFLSLEVHTSDKGKFLTNRSTHMILLILLVSLMPRLLAHHLSAVSNIAIVMTVIPILICLFIELLSGVIYLTTTRLNIYHAICIISQFMHDLCHLHLSVVEQNLIHMQNTILWIVLSSQFS